MAKSKKVVTKRATKKSNPFTFEVETLTEKEFNRVRQGRSSSYPESFITAIKKSLNGLSVGQAISIPKKSASTIRKRAGLIGDGRFKCSPSTVQGFVKLVRIYP